MACRASSSSCRSSSAEAAAACPARPVAVGLALARDALTGFHGATSAALHELARCGYAIFDGWAPNRPRGRRWCESCPRETDRRTYSPSMFRPVQKILLWYAERSNASGCIGAAKSSRTIHEKSNGGRAAIRCKNYRNLKGRSQNETENYCRKMSNSPSRAARCTAAGAAASPITAARSAISRPRSAGRSS